MNVKDKYYYEKLATCPKGGQCDFIEAKNHLGNMG